MQINELFSPVLWLLNYNQYLYSDCAATFLSFRLSSSEWVTILTLTYQSHSSSVCAPVVALSHHVRLNTSSHAAPVYTTVQLGFAHVHIMTRKGSCTGSKLFKMLSVTCRVGKKILHFFFFYLGWQSTAILWDISPHRIDFYTCGISMTNENGGWPNSLFLIYPILDSITKPQWKKNPL